MESLKSLLHANPIFASLPPAELTALAQLASSRAYEKGETVILYGDVWPYLFLVGEGSVNAVKESGEGRSLIVTTFLAGDLFWGLAFFQDGAPMPVTLTAREPSRLHLWSRESAQPIFERNGRVGWELCRLMAGRMQRASAILEEMAFQPVAGRLAHFLVEFAGDDSGKPIARNLTLDEMAAKVGSTREVVSRFLHRFSDQGLIEITRTEFSVTDRRGLEEMAKRAKG